jgi:tRNA(adenine34) deaminase
MPDADDNRFMTRALELARLAALAGEVPVGAVLVDAQGAVLGAARNACIGAHDPTAHAEIGAIRHAATAAGNYRLPGSTLYVTVEPCTMCAGALVHARVGRLVFGAREPKAGAVVSTARVLDNPALNHRIDVAGGVCEDEAVALMQEFFRMRRART